MFNLNKDNVVDEIKNALKRNQLTQKPQEFICSNISFFIDELSSFFDLCFDNNDIDTCRQIERTFSAQADTCFSSSLYNQFQNKSALPPLFLNYVKAWAHFELHMLSVSRQDPIYINDLKKSLSDLVGKAKRIYGNKYPETNANRSVELMAECLKAVIDSTYDLLKTDENAYSGIAIDSIATISTAMFDSPRSYGKSFGGVIADLKPEPRVTINALGSIVDSIYSVYKTICSNESRRIFLNPQPFTCTLIIYGNIVKSPETNIAYRSLSIASMTQTVNMLNDIICGTDRADFNFGYHQCLVAGFSQVVESSRAFLNLAGSRQSDEYVQSCVLLLNNTVICADNYKQTVYPAGKIRYSPIDDFMANLNSITEKCKSLIEEISPKTSLAKLPNPYFSLVDINDYRKDPPLSENIPSQLDIQYVAVIKPNSSLSDANIREALGCLREFPSKYAIDFSACKNLEILPTSCFEGSKNLVAVNLADCTGITKIGRCCFADCTEFQCIMLPPGLQTISRLAFAQSSLASIDIPDTVSLIGDGAFQDCKNLAYINFPSALCKINPYTFSGTELKNVQIPDTVSQIGTEAFSNCPSLSLVEFIHYGPAANSNLFPTASGALNQPSKSLKIGKRAFFNCQNLSEFKSFVNSIEIYDSAFENCRFSTLDFSSANEIGIHKKAFYGNSGLKSVTFGEYSIPEIDAYSFGNCGNLKYVALPKIQGTSKSKKYSTSINFHAFDGSQLKEIAVPFSNNTLFLNGISSKPQKPEAWLNFLNVLCAKADSNNLRAYTGLMVELFPYDTNVLLSDYCTTLPSEDASRNFINLANSIDPSSSEAYYRLTSIAYKVYTDSNETCPDNRSGRLAYQKSLFKNMSSLLKQCTLSYISHCETNNTLSAWALPSKVNKLRLKILAEAVNFPDKSAPLDFFEIIGSRSIEPAQKQISLPLSQQLISPQSICKGLYIVKADAYPMINPYWHSPEAPDYVIFGSEALQQIQSYTFPKWLNEHIIEYSALSLAKIALDLSSCSKLKQIPEGAFFSIKNLVYADLSGCTSLRCIDALAFGGCHNLRSVKFPIKFPDNHVFSIGALAFECCGLTELDLSHTHCKDILYGAFCSCEQLKSVALPPCTQSIGTAAFSMCKSLSTINFPPCLDTIGSYAFYCASLRSADLSQTQISSILPLTFAVNESLMNLKLPQTLTVIDYGAFYRCEALTEVNFPQSLNGIGKNAFMHSGLTCVDISNTGLLKIGEKAFSFCSNLQYANLNSNSPVTLYEYCFSQCSKLSSVTFPTNPYFNHIREGSFYETGLQKIDLSQTNVRQILDCSFAHNPFLREVIFPPTRPKISQSAFKHSPCPDGTQPVHSVATQHPGHQINLAEIRQGNNPPPRTAANLHNPPHEHQQQPVRPTPQNPQQVILNAPDEPRQIFPHAGSPAAQAPNIDEQTALLIQAINGISNIAPGNITINSDSLQADIIKTKPQTVRQSKQTESSRSQSHSQTPSK